MPSKTDLSSSPPEYAGVQTRADHGESVVAPWGEVDFGSAPLLYRAMGELSAGNGGVVLDMADVTFMDVAGLHFLRFLTAYGHEHRVAVRTVNWGRQPRRVLTVAGSLLPEPPRGAGREAHLTA
ncbi:STAS domain-containing protein [Streptomyces zingiberis]|uniref:STAS domain-containing protein n=1 Tax=Streptomyces zingiberis TaxID=2053010 RepID=A0ABX1C1C6_9ACTN|nr:STAS domain-containing protein [Streptomyces zingiberis]NJQ01677.1 STAS domain-containing protein [Streptomyces zingiberis]